MLNGKELLDNNTHIIYEKITTDELPLKVIEVTLAKDDPNLIPPKHWHRSLEFIIPLTASIELWSNGETYSIARNGLAIINSQAIHTAKIIESEDCFKSIVIQIKYDFLKKCYPAFDNIYFSNHIVPEIEQKLVVLLTNLSLEYQQTTEFKLLTINGYLYLIISILLKYQKKIRKVGYFLQSDQKLQEFMKILFYLDEHYSQALDVSSIANQFNFSYGYLARLFKKHLNITVKQYLTAQRLEHCTNDLIHTNLTITEIAMKNGFSSTKSFNREFKLKYHETPQVYRNKVRK